MEQIEIFIPVVGESEYFVSNLGRVASRKYGFKILKPASNRGYLYVSINGEKYAVHRLVAAAFLPVPKRYRHLIGIKSDRGGSLLQVNHKNEIPNDNRVENLEWCDQKYNSNYGNHPQRVGDAERTEILQFDLNKRFIACFKSITEASRVTRVSCASICICARKNGKYGSFSSCGFIWRIGQKDHKHPNKKTYKNYGYMTEQK